MMFDGDEMDNGMGGGDDAATPTPMPPTEGGDMGGDDNMGDGAAPQEGGM